MLFFKKKISFCQFLADLISYQLSFLETDFNKLVLLADESKVLYGKEIKANF